MNDIPKCGTNSQHGTNGGMPPSHYVRSIATDLILTLLTCGLYNLYVQHQQIQTINIMLGEPKYHFLNWLLLTVITCGLYHIYHEWRFTTDLVKVLKEPTSQLPLFCLVLSLFGCSFVADAIQQSEINRYFGNHSL